MQDLALSLSARPVGPREEARQETSCQAWQKERLKAQLMTLHIPALEVVQLEFVVDKFPGFWRKSDPLAVVRGELLNMHRKRERYGYPGRCGRKEMTEWKD